MGFSQVSRAFLCTFCTARLSYTGDTQHPKILERFTRHRYRNSNFPRKIFQKDLPP